MYLELLAGLPRHERYLYLLPPGLLTRRELEVAGPVYAEMRTCLALWEALLRAQLRAREGAVRGIP